LIPGGFQHKGRQHNLTGRPMAMLSALLHSRHRSCTVDQLRNALGVDDEAVSHPEQVIKDTATDLRKALKTAGVSKCPLPSTGRGQYLTYRLNLSR
jgi:hypothetical protein